MSITVTRRAFFTKAGSAACALTFPVVSKAAAGKISKPVRLGLIADLHQDVMHDGPKRLVRFLDAMKAQSPDAIVQLGDFAVPAPKNQPLIDRFNSAHSRAFHVLGNHDIDGGYTTQQVLDAWSMPSTYYTAEVNGLRLIVLDGNEPPADHQSGYPAHIGSQQAAWLKQELESDNRPTVVFSHQPLAGPWCIDNAQEIQQILSTYSDRVLLALNGHSHIDLMSRIDKVNYLHVNSASYVWVNSQYKHQNYPPEVLAKYPKLASACPYREALFTTLTFDPENNQVQIAPCHTDWVGPSPAQVGRDKHPQLTDGEEIAPRIRARTLTRIARNNQQ